MIRTIPDTIDLIKKKYKRFVDVPLFLDGIYWK